MYTYDSTSQWIPGYRFQYQVPPTSPASSIIRTEANPASRRRAPVSRPPNPAPTTSTSTRSVSGARSALSVYGSFA